MTDPINPAATTVRAVNNPDDLHRSDPRTVEAPPSPATALPTMVELREVATDLDDIDEILARLDDDAEAFDDAEAVGDAEAVDDADVAGDADDAEVEAFDDGGAAEAFDGAGPVGDSAPVDRAGPDGPDGHDPLLANR